jgi:acyl carrier protein
VGSEDLENEIEYVAPRNEMEAQLATIWAEVLGLPRVGIHDNFFAIGGHSLLIMQVLSRTSDAFEINLPVRTLFKTPTIAELAASIEKTRARNNELRQQALVPVSRGSFRQKRSALAEASENI